MNILLSLTILCIEGWWFQLGDSSASLTRVFDESDGGWGGNIQDAFTYVCGWDGWKGCDLFLHPCDLAWASLHGSWIPSRQKWKLPDLLKALKLVTGPAQISREGTTQVVNTGKGDSLSGKLQILATPSWKADHRLPEVVAMQCNNVER